MSSEMNPNVEIGGSVVAYAPASSANLSVGFDVLGRRSPRGWLPCWGQGTGEAGRRALRPLRRGSLCPQVAGRPEKNILHDCWVAYGEALEKRGLGPKPLEMVLEKNLPVGSGLGSSACSVVAALEGLNAFPRRP